MSDNPAGTGAPAKQTADGRGKHRGQAAPSEESGERSARGGRHRRPPQEAGRDDTAAA